MLHLLPTVDDRTMEAQPTPQSASEQVRTLLLHRGPYTSVYLATRPLLRTSSSDTARRWSDLRARLEAQCAPPAALAAIEDRLAVPLPEDTAAIGIIAAADGTSIVDHGLEPPGRDFGTVEALPYLAPLFEWEQRGIPHLMVSVVPTGADVVTFAVDSTADVMPVSGPIDVVCAAVTELADAIAARVVVIGGREAGAEELADALRLRLHPSVHVATEFGGVDAFAEATVLQVADRAARETVGFLRELRFERTHDDAADGTESTLEAIRAGVRGTLLIHDDPEDLRRVWVGPHPADLSATPRPGWQNDARLVDAAICAVIASGGRVHIVPSTGSQGPENDAALIRRRSPVAAEEFVSE
ncbi:MAG: hypothetical protein ACI9C1_000495 [Candidatus Aldehydirespiratoraceae bacterium]|jgi:hypothetical protein